MTMKNRLPTWPDVYSGMMLGWISILARARASVTVRLTQESNSCSGTAFSLSCFRATSRWFCKSYAR